MSPGHEVYNEGKQADLCVRDEAPAVTKPCVDPVSPSPHQLALSASPVPWHCGSSHTSAEAPAGWG